MARQLSITITDVMEAFLRKAAVERGTTPEQLASEVIAGALGVIPAVPATRAELEQELLKGLEGPAAEISPAEWERKKADLIERFGRSKAG